MLITTLVLLGVVGIAAVGFLPIVTASVAGCAVLMLTGCLPPREAYQAINLSLVFLLAGTLALGNGNRAGFVAGAAGALVDPSILATNCEMNEAKTVLLGGQAGLIIRV